MQSKRFTLVVGTVLCVLAGAGGIPAASAQNPENAGISVTEDGKALAGARVQVLIWPDASVRAKTPKGKVLPLQVVLDAKTGARGTVESAGMVGTLRSFKARADYVNVEVQVRKGDRVLVWTSPISTATSSTLGSLTGTSLDFKTGAVSTRVVSRGGGTSVGTTARRAEIAVISDVTSSGGRGATTNVVCAYVSSTWHYGLPEAFTKIRSWSGAKVTLRQKTGSDHTTGVGFNRAGSSSWSVSGSQTISSSNSSTDVTTGIFDDRVWNKVNFRDYWNTCGWTQRRPESFHTLTCVTTDIPDENFAYGCYVKTSGSFTKTDGTNTTQSGAIDIGPINVNAQAGWDTEVSAEFVVTSPTKLCASSASGTATAPEVSARPGG